MTAIMDRQLAFETSNGQLTIGFTGTQIGMTMAQIEGVMEVLEAQCYFLARHGDCIGSDAEFDSIANAYGLYIHIHPCNLEDKRAWTKNFVIEHPVREPLVRNRDIVNLSDFMIATPSGTAEELRSGTWATVRYARKVGKPYRIIFPDGKFESSVS